MKKLAAAFLLLGFAAVLCHSIAWAQDKKKTIRRAKPPTFSDKDTKLIFFDDVFADQNGGLVGARPADLGKVATTVATSGGDNTGGSGGGSAGGLYGWKAIIDGEAIEDEVKSIATSLTKNITTPTKYAGGGYKQSRKDFSILAMLFAISGEYDGDVRWQKDAPELRDLFAHAARSAKVGSPQSYNEAKLRRDELTDLVRGTTFVSRKPAEPKASWDQVCDVSPLMQRLEVAKDEYLKPLTGNAADFKANKDKLNHHANIVAAISEVMIQEGMENFDEEDYKGFSIEMKKAARDVVDAIQLDNYDGASKAVGAMDQACAQCHSDWR